MEKSSELYPINDFVLSHYTRNHKLNKILDSGYLKFYNPIDPGTEDLCCASVDNQGTFYSLITPDNKLHIKNGNYFSEKVFLFFKPELLKDYNNLYNPYWNFGQIMEGSYVYKRILNFTEEQNLLFNLNHMNSLLKNNTYDEYAINKTHEINVYDKVYIPLEKYLIGVLIPKEKNKIDIDKLRKEYPKVNFIDSNWKDYEKFVI